MKETIRQAIIHWRNKAKLRQDQLADIIPVTRSTYQSYEDGRAMPSVLTLFRLCEIYQLKTMDELIFYNTSHKLPTIKKDILFDRYLEAGPEKRKIIDFILNVNNYEKDNTSEFKRQAIVQTQ